MIRKTRALAHLHADERESALNIATKNYFSKMMAGQELVYKKSASANLKLGYKKTLEICSILALGLVIATAQVSRVFSISVDAPEQVDVTIEVADIPITEQVRRPPAPPKPSVPIPTESEEIPDDVTIASTNIDLSDIPAPPPPPDDDDTIFIAYDEPPQIIGGMRALAKELKYPRLAQASGLEGVVFVKVLVSADGKTERAEIMKSKPANMGFEESAVRAIRKMRWHPAKQRDRNIRVWVSIPVQFRLINS